MDKSSILVNRIPPAFSADIVSRAISAPSRDQQLVILATPLDIPTSSLDPTADAASPHAVLAELFHQALRQGSSMHLSTDQIATLLNILKAVHDESMTKFLLVQRSFTLFRQHVLSNSVERPPFSRATFSMHECKIILEWALDSYFAHYKMYLYVFRNKVQKDVKTIYPYRNRIEVPINSQLGRMNDALTEEEYTKKMAEEANVRVAAEASAAEERGAAEAAEAAALVAAARNASTEAAVAEALAALQARWQPVEAQLIERRSELEQRVAPPRASTT